MRKLKLLLAAAALMLGVGGVSAQQSWTSSAVGAGTFYLYNVGGAGFIVGANNWGTRAGVDATGGIPVTLTLNNGAYTISTAPTFSGKYLGSNGYVDGSSADWTFEAVAGETNVYKMRVGNNYLFADNVADVTLPGKTTTVGGDPGTNMAYWKLVSKNDLFAWLAKATPSSPVWASCLINNPGFGRNTNTGLWNVVADNKNMSGGTNENSCAEHWRSAFTTKQTISGIPNGIYRLRVQAALTDYADKYDGANYPVVYIKSGESEGTAIFNNMEGTDRASNMNTLSASFSAGKYFTDFAQVEVSNGEIEIGVRGTRTDTWCIYDNFQLQMYDPYINTAAEGMASTGGAMEAGKWYSFTVASDGEYGFSPISDIVYTTNGNQLQSSGTGSALAEEMELTAGTVYYVKSATAQTLSIIPKTFSYEVGTATANMSYIQTGKTVTITYANLSTNNPDADPIFNLSGVTFNGTAISCTPTANGFTFVVPEVAVNGNYTLSIPVNTIGYEVGSVYNEAQDIVLKTPAVFDGTYYLFNPFTKRFLGRGNSYGTAAVVDKYGIPFNLTVDNDGYATMVFLDNNQGLFGTDWCWTDNTAASYMYESATIGDYSGFAIKVKGVDTNNRLYAYVNEGNADNYRVAANANVGSNCANEAQTVWQLKTPAERNTILNDYITENYEKIITDANLSTTAAEFETYLNANYAGKDYTAKVGTARFAGSVGSWTWNQERGQSNQPAYINDAAEAWCATGSWTQTISELPKGIYRVTINGFERRANNAKSYELGEAGFGTVTSSYLKANDEQVRIKSWYEEVVKNGNSYNPNSMSEAVTAFNNDKYKSTLYTYVGDDGELKLTIAKPNYIFDCWLLWNNITLTYYTDQVDPEEVTSLLEAAEAQLAKPMLATLKTAINDAKTALESNSTIANYNALQAAIDNSQTSVDSYAAMKTNYLDRLANVMTNTNIYTAAAKANIYDGYLTKYNNGTISNAEANALNAYSGDKGTRPIDQLLMPSWTVGGNAPGNTFYQNTWSTEGASDGSNFLLPFYEYWVSDASVLAATTLTATQTGLTPNGIYDVSVWVRVRQSNAGDKIENAVTMQVGTGLTVDISAGDQIGSSKLYIKEYTARGKADADGKLTINMTVAEGSNISWLAFKNISYSYIAGATDEEKTALANAITTAEGKTIGFEDGEYAPYNNVEALTKLAAAKAIDPETVSGAEVVAATTALTSATWTANDGEVNAIAYGDFGTYETVAGEDMPYGWNLYNPDSNHSRIMGGTQGSENVGLEASSTGKALLLKWNATYGEATGYTMPLKAATAYKIAFTYCGWGGNTPQTSVVMTDPNGTSITLNPVFKPSTGDGQADASHWYNFEGYFVTTTAGDYKFNLNKIESGQQQIAICDIDLRTTSEITFADGSVPTYAPGTYPTVKISRTLTENKWATAIYPFKVSGVESIAVLSSYDNANNAVGFSSADYSEANKPFLMKSSATMNNIELNNVEVAKAEAINDVKEPLSFIGVYKETEVGRGVDVKNFVLKNNTIYRVGDKTATINPYRAYFQVAQPAQPGEEARLKFFINGQQTTDIEGLKAEKSLNGVIYNLNGQRIEKANKGLYISNGKKVVLK